MFGAGALAKLFVSIDADVSSFDRGMQHVESSMHRAAQQTEQQGNRITNALGAVVKGLGAIGLASMGVQALVGSARGLGEALGVGLQAELEDVRAQFMAFTKDAAMTERILKAVRAEADKTPFEFREMAAATASLIPAARMANEPLLDLVKTGEILAASNPAQGLAGAAFSLREAVSGDFTSIIERFNLPRSYINKLKEEGVPALEIVRRSMTQMGFDMDLVTRKAETLGGRWSTFKDSIDSIRIKVSQPIFDRLKIGLEQVQKWLEDNRATIDLWASRVAAAFGIVIDGVGWLARNFASGLSAVYNTVVSWGRAIYEALQWLNPFATHSPSLVSEVDSGVTAILGSYRRATGSTADMSVIANAVRGLSGDLTTFNRTGRDAGYVFTDVGSAVERFRGMADKLKDSVRPAEREVDALKRAVAGYRDELNRVVSMPILGSKAFGDQAFAIDQQMAEIQKQINEKKLAMPALQPPPHDADRSTQDAYQRQVEAQRAALKPLEDELDRLRLIADNVRLSEKIDLDPIRRQLQELAKPIQEIDRATAATLIGRYRGEIERLGPQAEIAEGALERLKEQVQDEKAGGAGGAGGGGLFGAGGGGLKLPEIDTSELDNFKEQVERARKELETKFTEISTNVSKALEPVTKTWDRMADAWVEGGLIGALKETAEIAGEIGEWLGGQWAKVDWSIVWARATTLGTAIFNSGIEITPVLQSWLGAQWLKIDWLEVVKRKQDTDTQIAEWIKTWETEASARATANWLFDVFEGGMGETVETMDERLRLWFSLLPQNLAAGIFSKEALGAAIERGFNWLGILFEQLLIRATQAKDELWRRVFGAGVGLDDEGAVFGRKVHHTPNAKREINPMLPGRRDSLDVGSPTSQSVPTPNANLVPVTLNITLGAEQIVGTLWGDPEAAAQLYQMLERQDQINQERY